MYIDTLAPEYPPMIDGPNSPRIPTDQDGWQSTHGTKGFRYCSVVLVVLQIQGIATTLDECISNQATRRLSFEPNNKPKVMGIIDGA